MIAGALMLLGGGGLYAYSAIKAEQAAPPPPRPALALAETVAGVQFAGLLPVRLVESGFGQNNQRLAVYFMVENPTNTALRDVPYLLTLEGASAPLTSTGVVDLALAGERQTVVRTLFLPAEVEISAVTVELGSGTALSLAKELLYPTVLNTRYRSAASGLEYDQAQAVLDNTMDEPLTNLNMTALIYNQAGEVIGAGSRHWSEVLDQGTTRPSLDMTVWSADPVGKTEFSFGWTPASFDYGLISREPESGERGYGVKQPDNGVFHAQVGSEVEYPSLPPTSGRHWPQIATYGDYGDQELPDEILVHNLEHGAVIISYDPARITVDDQATLTALFDELYYVNDHVIMVQRADIDHPIALTAWNYRLLLDEADPAAIRGFYHAHIARGPECFNRRCP